MPEDTVIEKNVQYVNQLQILLRSKIQKYEKFIKKTKHFSKKCADSQQSYETIEHYP